MHTEVRESARCFSEAVARERERPPAEEGIGHWVRSWVDDGGNMRLLCVIHTCGITRAQVDGIRFRLFYRSPESERALEARSWTQVDFGLVIWVSVPRFGPQE